MCIYTILAVVIDYVIIQPFLHADVPSFRIICVLFLMGTGNFVSVRPDCYFTCQLFIFCCQIKITQSWDIADVVMFLVT